MKRVLVTGAGGSASVGFTRCLKIAPEKIFTVGTECNEKFVFNSETNVKILVPPAKSPDYIDVLNEILAKYAVDFLHVQPDVEVGVLSENREKIKCSLFLPSKETIKICQDKLESNRIWQEKNVPTSRTTFIETGEDLRKAFEAIGAPLWVRAIKGAGGKGSLLVHKYEHAESWIDYWNGWGNFMASEYLPGSNLGWDAIFKDGDLISCQIKERLEYMLARASPSGITGTTAIAKSVNNKKVDKIAKEAIRAVDPKPHGVFSVDLKADKNGNFMVTEINPGRFLTSSLHFFYTAKNLMPYTYLKIAYNEKVPENVLKQKTPEGTILIRSLDSKPMILKEKKLNELVADREKKQYVVVE
jgi:carbamoyl-phosphate synthase large subunit